MGTIYIYILKDLFKNKALILYSIILIVSISSLIYIESDIDKVLLSVMQLALTGIPLFCMLFTAIYLYHNSDFIELILSQPIQRQVPILAIFLALLTWLVTTFVVSVILPLIFMGADYDIIIMLLGTNMLLQMSSISIALFIGNLITDKVRGVGVILLLWVFHVLLFDGLLLLVMYQFASYPIEKVILYMTFLNPITICRTLITLSTESSALLGLSAAIFNKFFTSFQGVLIAYFSLLFWGLLPLFGALKIFSRKDY